MSLSILLASKIDHCFRKLYQPISLLIMRYKQLDDLPEQSCHDTQGYIPTPTDWKRTISSASKNKEESISSWLRLGKLDDMEGITGKV